MKNAKMLKIFKYKNGNHDVVLIWTIITIFFLIGGILPFIQRDLNMDVTEYNINKTVSDTGQSMPDSETSIIITAVNIFISIITMFFWNFNVPFWLNLTIFMPMRIALFILIYRQLRSGGG